MTALLSAPAALALTLAPATASSDRAEDIRTFLRETGRVDTDRLKIQVENHIATVRGAVRSLDEAEWIADTIYATDQVYGAVQDLEIDHSLYVQDEARETLRHIFAHAPALAGSKLRAEATPDGTVVISGEAGYHDELQLAREFASRIDGVREIRVTAHPSPLMTRPPEAIARQLDLMLLDDPLLAHCPVIFEVKEATLHVRGAVGSREMYRYLLDRVMIGGLHDLDATQLRIDPAHGLRGMSPKRYFPDDSVKVLTMLVEADPRLTGHDLEISENNGIVQVRVPRSDVRLRRILHDNIRGLPGIGGIQISGTAGNAVAARP